MFKTKFIISAIIITIFLVITSVIKNKTRIIEKKISNFNVKILSKKKDINEAQLDFHYLTSPAEIEKKLSVIGLVNYQPIEYSKIFFDILDFNKFKINFQNLKIMTKKKLRNNNNTNQKSFYFEDYLETNKKKRY